MIALATSALAGCASRYPKYGLSSIGAGRVVVIEPRTADELKLQVSDWARLPAASVVKSEAAWLNASLGGWREPVVSAFSHSLVAALEQRSVVVERAALSAHAGSPGKDPSVRSFLSAGLVYRTFTSSAFVPFISVVLELVAPTGRVVYHRLYVVTNRPFNLLMESFPADTAYGISELSLLLADGPAVILALQAMAKQLGEKFASELLA